MCPCVHLEFACECAGIIKHINGGNLSDKQTIKRERGVASEADM